MKDMLNELRTLQRSGKGYHTRRIAGQGADEIERLSAQVAALQGEVATKHACVVTLERELAEARDALRLAIEYIEADSSDEPTELLTDLRALLAALEVPR